MPSKTSKRERLQKYWLCPNDAYLERVKQDAKRQSWDSCDQLISVHLLRIIAALRHQRGGCPTCGLKRGHRKGSPCHA